MANTDAYPVQVTFQPGPTSRYQWVAAGPNPCNRCAELDGQVRSLETWNASINPGFHLHCHCYLQCVDLLDSGMAFADQFTHIGVTDLLACISAMFTPCVPEPLHHRHHHEEAEGVEDLAPYLGETHRYAPREHPGAERPT